ncbi:Ribonuclease T2 precursor (RNase T2) [Rhodotorula kratochvilovae]
MLRTALFAATAATLVVADPSPNLLNVVEGILGKVQDKAQNLLGLKACPAPFLLPTSCSNGVSPSHKGLNECCTNVPGGLQLLTQFWNAQPDVGPNNSWTIHGLWPDNCDGTYEQYCDSSREYTNIREILTGKGETKLVEFMNTYWKSNTNDDESLWSHEWDKHGASSESFSCTCISTLNETCYGRSYKKYDDVVDYFERTHDLFQTLPTYDWLAAEGIVPSRTATYTADALQAAIKKHYGYEVYFGCTSAGELDEVWYYYLTKGPVAGGKYIPTQVVGSKGSCPATGIKYLPKDGTSSGGGNAPSGNYTVTSLNVEYNSAQDGCLISSGKWYTTGTCATYRLYGDVSSGFTMTTSKGACTVSAGAQLSCAAGNAPSTFTLDDDNYLSYDGSNAFFASVVAEGTTQADVFTSVSEASVPIKVRYGAPK